MATRAFTSMGQEKMTLRLRRYEWWQAKHQTTFVSSAQWVFIERELIRQWHWFPIWMCRGVCGYNRRTIRLRTSALFTSAYSPHGQRLRGTAEGRSSLIRGGVWPVLEASLLLCFTTYDFNDAPCLTRFGGKTGQLVANFTYRMCSIFFRPLLVELRDVRDL